MNYNWNSIHALDGSQQKAFEELCAQLARTKTPDGATFRRKGAPDAGVECYCTLPDGSEWGWQAKYFDTLGASQWQQLDDSIKTAIEKHPSLVRYFIRKNDLSAFKRWAQGVDFYGRWMPDTPGSYNLFLGEYGWSPAFAYLQRQDEDVDDWTTPERDCPVSIRSAAYQYYRESGDFDCSVDRGYTLQLPHHEFIETLKLKWAGSGADYLDQHGKRAAFDPTAYEDGSTALLLREDLVKEYLADKELAFCWIVVGGKRVIGPDRGREYDGGLRISGAIYYTEHGPEDFVSSKYHSPADLVPKGNLPT